MIVLNWITVSVFYCLPWKWQSKSKGSALTSDKSEPWGQRKGFFFKSICWPQLQNDSIITRKHEKKHEKHEKQQEKHKKSEVGRIIAIWSASTHRGQCAPKSTVGSWHVWHLIGYGLKVWNKTAVWTFTWISEMRCLLCDLQPIDPDPFLNLSMFVPCRPEMVEHCAKRPCKFVSMSGLPHGPLGSEMNSAKLSGDPSF